MKRSYKGISRGGRPGLPDPSLSVHVEIDGEVIAIVKGRGYERIEMTASEARDLIESLEDAIFDAEFQEVSE